MISKYLVGGAVRDMLLGLDPKDKDYVVVGSTPEEMVSLGFEQVGKDFPVFLHPVTGDEYALARKERKVGIGYYGFDCDYSSSVTLEEDLFRRDLTINAIAYDESEKKFIDPFFGATDLKNRILKHVSSHFKEDPVRILRICRFAARYGFEIHPETQGFIKEMVENGEFDSLVPERVWLEIEKTMNEKTPSLFFKWLFKLNALERLPGFNKVLVEFSDLDLINEGASIDEKIACVFKNFDDKTLAKYKMTSFQMKYSKYWRDLEHDILNYKDLNPQDKVNVILRTQANHDIKILSDLFLNIYSVNKKGDVLEILRDLTADVDAIKNIDYKSISENAIKNKLNVKEEITKEQIKAIRNTSGKKCKMRF